MNEKPPTGQKCVSLGAFEPKLTLQLKGLAPKKDLALFDEHSTRITWLHVHGLLTSNETMSARKRLMKRIQGRITSVGRASPQGALPVPEKDFSSPVPLQEAQGRPVADTERLDWLSRHARWHDDLHRLTVIFAIPTVMHVTLRDTIDAAISASSKASEENKTETFQPEDHTP